ncbi:glutamate racemase [Photobacterium profundum]|uniref:Glutamate racemase n=1 Tax=Photobacterium profundum 3TCK TaxID=314280 RepID=Q1YWX4_9GAMM|nr:glutamate racemase [Photobacterium profundum]EAS40821.1 glutamate racemase [Photobacterium profundum 3TCK]PSV59666.1 glutamate racemase [Photobacterium profundum]
MVKTILIFDSGVGGLSVYQEIQSLMPQIQYIYAFDNAAFPYGELAEDVLLQRTQRIVCSLAEKHNVDLVVIACNTASTIVLPILRENLSVPVVGVVPAIKPAAILSQTKVIGLLATPATIHRSYTHELISSFASDCEVRMIGSTRLVEIAEEKLRGLPVSIDEIAEIIKPWQKDVDCIILGCTHFPLIKDEIRQALDKAIVIVDSGKAIANRVKGLLGDLPSSYKKHLNLTYNSAATNNEAALNRSLEKIQLNAMQPLRLLDF